MSPIEYLISHDLKWLADMCFSIGATVLIGWIVIIILDLIYG